MAKRKSNRTAEHHYMVVFASQPPSNRPRFAHAFASFLTAPAPNDPTDVPIVPDTPISWLPSTKVIRPFTRPQPGTNFDMATTIEWALRNKRTRVSAWGPFRIKRPLYESALRRAAEVSANYLYQAVDRDFRRPNVTNCIHALSDLDLFSGPLHTNWARGERASRMVVDRFTPWIINPDETYRWVVDALGLSAYAIRFREI